MDNPSKIARGGDAPGLKQFHSCLGGDLDLAHPTKFVAARHSRLWPQWRCNQISVLLECTAFSHVYMHKNKDIKATF